MRPSPLRPLPVAVLALALAGCDLLEEAVPDAPAGEPPPAGFATEMVDAHNAVRAGATPAPTPPLDPLAWSTPVAATAQAWADGCAYAHNPDLHALGYGENIAATAPAGARGAAYIVGLWASEAPFYDYATDRCDWANPANEPHTCGHYTQLVWRSTTVVGCAVQTCPASSSPFGGGASGAWNFWVCDYAPPGNWVGQRPY
jgi:hypothetical protein